MPEPRYIFLSHNSDDKPDVEKLVQLIESHPLAQEHSLKVWLDKNDLQHGVQYTNQFSRYINDKNTCAFVLFMPKKAIRAYVEYEINVAFDRQMNDKNEDKAFPLLPLYPMGNEERQPLPEVISTYNYRQNVLQDETAVESVISDALGLYVVSKKLPGGDEPGPIPASEQWFCFDLTLDDNTIVIQAENSTCKTEFPIDVLLEAKEDQCRLILIMRQLFPKVLDEDLDAPKRLRIRTDVPELAMLPWAAMHDETVVELSPLANHYRPDFDSLNISTPLVIIPNQPPEIASNSHYRLLHEYFDTYFNIKGPIPRITDAKKLEPQLKMHKPDFIYLYARVNGEKIELDHSSSIEPITLEQLATWIKEAGIRPVVFLSMLGTVLSEYPASLAKVSRLVWVQSTPSDKDFKTQQIRDNLANTLENLPKNSDLIKLINSNFEDQKISHNLWVSGQSPKLDTSNYQLNQQLRVALLRVLLGRTSIKNNLSGEITQSQRSNKNNCISYAISGDESACPFDVPAQLQQRLDWDDPKHGFPIIAFHLPLSLDEDIEPIESMEALIDSCLTDRRGDIRGTFESELRRRGLTEAECCIALNWNITIPQGMPLKLSEWLKEWGVFMSREVIGEIPEKVLLLNAICLQVEDASVAQDVQNTANKELRELSTQGIGLIRIVDALGKLQDYEISDFFLDNPQWSQALKLDTYNINPNTYADWIHQRSNQGEFEQSVNLIWQQYQNDYQDYP